MEFFGGATSSRLRHCWTWRQAAVLHGKANTPWNMEQQGDVWPGDVLAVSSTSAGLNEDLVVRKVQIELLCTSPGMTKYLVEFANDWADALAIKTSKTVPADVWLPQQPETTPPLANLAAMSVTVTLLLAPGLRAGRPTGGRRARAGQPRRGPAQPAPQTAGNPRP